MARVVLIGVVHGEPGAEERLLRLLREIGPRTVGLEVSTFSIDFRRRHGERLRALLERRVARLGLGGHEGPISWLRRYLDVPFEWAASERFARETGAEILALGDPRAAAGFLDLVEEELLAAESLARGFASGAAEADVESAKRRARRLFSEPDRYVFAGDRHLLAWRDSAAALALRKRASELPGDAAVAYVAGFEHVLVRGDVPNVGRALADLSPERILL